MENKYFNFEYKDPFRRQGRKYNRKFYRLEETPYFYLVYCKESNKLEYVANKSQIFMTEDD